MLITLKKKPSLAYIPARVPLHSTGRLLLPAAFSNQLLAAPTPASPSRGCDFPGSVMSTYIIDVCPKSRGKCTSWCVHGGAPWLLVRSPQPVGPACLLPELVMRWSRGHPTKTSKPCPCQIVADSSPWHPSTLLNEQQGADCRGEAQASLALGLASFSRVHDSLQDRPRGMQPHLKPASA